MNETTAELLPCPFCGSADVTVDIFDGVNEDWKALWNPEYVTELGDAFVIMCAECGFTSGEYAKPEHILDRWNKRTDSTSQIAALRSALESIRGLPNGKSHTRAIGIAIKALAAEVKRLTEENTSITNALEFLGVECAAELRWIPIRSADDLPKENGFYLATCGSVGIDPDDTTSHELNWFGGKWYLPSDEMIEMDGVIAWMKKPKPYTEPADNIGEGV